MTEQPQDENASRLDEEGVPELIDAVNPDEGIMPPGEQPRFSDAVDVTAAGQRRGETLDERVEQEAPDERGGGAGGLRGRLAEDPDDPEMIAEEAPGDHGALSAEEDSVRERRSP